MSGNYQHTDNLEELKTTWKPEDMLPRACKDKRVPAPVIDGTRNEVSMGVFYCNPGRRWLRRGT